MRSLALHVLMIVLLTRQCSFATHTMKINRKWDIQNWFVGAENDVSAVVDINHDLIVLGSTNGLDSTSFFVEKLDGYEGTKLWEVVWPGSAAKYPQGLCTDSNGDIIVVGSTNIDLHTPHLNNSVDIFIEKWNGTDGSILWGTQLGSNGSDIAMSAISLENGQLFVTGTTTSTLFSSIDTVGDAFFVAEINGSTGLLLGGFQEASPREVVKLDSVGTHLRTDKQGHVLVIGNTEGLYGMHRDGGDAFAVKFNASLDWYGEGGRWWGVQVDLRTSSDIVRACDVDLRGDVYLMGYSIVKLSGLTGHVMWQRFSAQEGGYSFNALVALDYVIFLVGSHVPPPSEKPSPKFNMAIGLIGIESESGHVKLIYNYGTSGNEKGLLIAADTANGNKYIVGTTDVNVTLRLPASRYPSNSDTDRKIWKVRIFDDPPPPVTFGYEVDSRMVVLVLIFLCFLPIALLLAFCHRDPTIPFWIAFRRISLPVLDFITNILYLLTADFFSEELFTLCWVDLVVINLLPVLFYEWAVYQDSADYQKAVRAGGRYTPLLDIFCICSVDAKNLFKDYEANDAWPCDGSDRRYPHPCNVLWTALVLLFSLAVASIDMAVKFFFYQFKLLNYMFKSQHRYVKENVSLNQRAQNYEILTHVICQSLVQIIVQSVNGLLVKEGYTKIALLSIAVSGTNIAVALYWYGIRYCIYLTQGSVASFTNLSKVAVADDELYHDIEMKM